MRLSNCQAIANLAKIAFSPSESHPASDLDPAGAGGGGGEQEEEREKGRGGEATVGRERAERGREGGAGEQEARSGRAGGRGSRRRVRRLRRLREGVNKKYLGFFCKHEVLSNFSFFVCN